jgi:predicted nucleic acid-binding protein
LIAFLNRGDRHHRWAVNVIESQRNLRAPIVVPEVVAGEAFTKLRYDRLISGRRDARPALTVFGLLAADSELFETRGMPRESHRRSVDLLARYVDQTFSWVDAIVLLTADDDRRVERLWTVDSTLGAYRFSHQVVVSSSGN